MQARLLPDGARLHLHHGPIDIIVSVNSAARKQAFAAAAARFETVLDELVAELPLLRLPVAPDPCSGAIAQKMQQACLPHLPKFITPMAAVAGAVADEILATIRPVPGLIKASVNNGGDIAFHLSAGQTLAALMPGGQVELHAKSPWRGIATSGWRGRSHSRGIADTVSVIARSAAQADAAATMIANAVDLPGHSAIARVPANELAPDSDLGARLVTTDIGPLSPTETQTALANGARYARHLFDTDIIGGAYLSLNTHQLCLGPEPRQFIPKPEPQNA